ncbi:MAG: hypothetical protein ACR2PH_01025 [Desulfobulbia bacterium]
MGLSNTLHAGADPPPPGAEKPIAAGGVALGEAAAAIPDAALPDAAPVTDPVPDVGAQSDVEPSPPDQKLKVTNNRFAELISNPTTYPDGRLFHQKADFTLEHVTHGAVPIRVIDPKSGETDIEIFSAQFVTDVIRAVDQLFCAQRIVNLESRKFIDCVQAGDETYTASGFSAARFGFGTAEKKTRLLAVGGANPVAQSLRRFRDRFISPARTGSAMPNFKKTREVTYRVSLDPLVAAVIRATLSNEGSYVRVTSPVSNSAIEPFYLDGRGQIVERPN